MDGQTDRQASRHKQIERQTERETSVKTKTTPASAAKTKKERFKLVKKGHQAKEWKKNHATSRT